MQKHIIAQIKFVEYVQALFRNWIYDNCTNMFNGF